MSFLKKRWRFAAPTVVVLCVLILGVVVLYSPSEPPEPKRVYVMPERSSTDNPVSLNTGGVLLSASTPPAAQLASDYEASQTAPIGPIAAGQEPMEQPPEDVETCCPDDAISIAPDGVFRAGLTFENWMTAIADHHENEAAYHADFDKQVDELLVFFQRIVAQVPTDKRAELFADVKSQIQPDQFEYLQEFWEGVPETTDLTPDEIPHKLEDFRAGFAASDGNHLALKQEAQQLLSE